MIKKMQNVKSLTVLTLGRWSEKKFSEVGVEVLIIRGLTSKITASENFVDNIYGKDLYCQRGM